MHYADDVVPRFRMLCRKKNMMYPRMLMDTCDAFRKI